MLLQQYDDTTGEFKVFSRLTGGIVFDGVIHNIKLQQEIIDAIRKAENLACNYTKSKAIQHLEVM